MMYPHCSMLAMDLGYLFIQSLKSHFDLNTQIFLSLKTQPLVHVVRGGNSVSVFQVHPRRCLNGPGNMLANGALVKQTNRNGSGQGVWGYNSHTEPPTVETFVSTGSR